LFAYRAYRRTASRSLGRLAVGFAVITLGSLVAGIADQFTSLSTVHALLIESGLTAAGLAVILHALYVD
ncbi:MAG: hypothetical protein R3324_13860, partial [Halobacteriales archaeon]|nr:hypothetical protein [Halobacteriales archaeon]